MGPTVLQNEFGVPIKCVCVSRAGLPSDYQRRSCENSAQHQGSGMVVHASNPALSRQRQVDP